MLLVVYPLGEPNMMHHFFSFGFGEGKVLSFQRFIDHILQKKTTY